MNPFFMRKKVFSVCILLVLAISLISINYISAQNKVSSENLKNYGKCISESAKTKNECYKDAGSEYKTCKIDAKTSSLVNRRLNSRLYKELQTACRGNYKDSMEKCKENYKQDKEGCLVYKNPECANNGEKVFINSDFGPTSCCSKNAGVKPSSFEVDGACAELTDGSKGTCVNNWWKTCGDGVCDIRNEDKCNCPKDCLKDCDENCITGVCDENNNCINPDNPQNKCDLLLTDIKKENENVKECKSDPDCVIGTIGLPCIMEQCYSVYNKDSDLKLLKELSKNYIKNCQVICPMIMGSMLCLDPSFSEAKCVENKCTIKPKEVHSCDSNTQPGLEIVGCTDLYQPVCGWFNPGVKCFAYPCAQTFSNSCYSCSNENVLYWTEGECPARLIS